MLGHHIAAAGVIAEHAVGGNGIIVKIQQHKGHARLHRCGKVAAADLAHKDEAVHLAVYKEGGHIAAFSACGRTISISTEMSCSAAHLSTARYRLE